MKHFKKRLFIKVFVWYLCYLLVLFIEKVKKIGLKRLQYQNYQVMISA